jgi:hypothetical protein
MKTQDYFHHSNKQEQKKHGSITRSLEKLQGKLALLAEWENTEDVDPEYMKELKKRIEMQRNQLRFKGAL